VKILLSSLLLIVGSAASITVFSPATPAQQVSEISDLPEKPEPLVKKHFPVSWLALTLAGQAAALADCDATLHLRHNYPNFNEHDPLGRPFVHLPAPAYIAVSVGLVSILSVASFKMNRSSNPWVRRLWWVPQTIQIGLSTNSAVYTSSWPAKISVAQVRAGARSR